VSRSTINSTGTNLVEKGHLLVVTRTGVKKLAIAPCDIAISQDITGVVLNESKCLPRFLFWQLDCFAHKMEKWKQGTSIQGILLDDLRNIPVWVPGLTDQRRAIDILDAANEAVESARKLAEQTRRLKDALAQDLLVHAVSKKRFPIRTARLGHLFTERTEPGSAGLPTMSVTMNDGIVDREDMDRRVESELTPQEHLLARKGDIAYNMMRMWQGVSGLIPHDSLISPAYVVVTPTKEIDAAFAAHLFKLPEIIRLLRRYSQGLTEDRLRLYFHQFAEIQVSIPKDKAQQQRIAHLLTTLANTADAHEARLSALVRTKTAISNKIFSN